MKIKLKIISLALFLLSKGSNERNFIWHNSWKPSYEIALVNPSCAGVTFQVTQRIGSVLSRLLRRDGVNIVEEKEAELHLYAVSEASRLYLHLQSSWNSFIIVSEEADTGWVFTTRCLIFTCLCVQKSTLMLDPLYRRRCTASADPLAPTIR